MRGKSVNSLSQGRGGKNYNSHDTLGGSTGATSFLSLGDALVVVARGAEADLETLRVEVWVRKFRLGRWLRRGILGTPAWENAFLRVSGFCFCRSPSHSPLV